MSAPNDNSKVELLQHAGEPCTSCQPFWEDQGMGPPTLQNTGKKTDFGIDIIACPYCDGPLLERNA